MRRLPSRPLRIGALTGAAALLLALPSPVLADVSVGEEGRQTRTRPKQPQREYNGILLDPLPSEVGERPSGRSLGPAGRRLSSEPQGRVSVGIIGCPGCQEAANAAGGVIIDQRRPNRPSPPRARERR